MTAFPSADEIAYIYEGARNRTLPKDDWTHQAHIVFGTALVCDVGLAEAERRCPDHIRRYNESVGYANTDDEGYHHTITIFYLREIAAFLDRTFGAALAATPLEDAVAAILASPIADRNHPLTAYPKALLFSRKARRGWVPPPAQPSGNLS